MNLELRNVNGNNADVYTGDGILIASQWFFNMEPKEGVYSTGKSDAFPLKRVIKLKDAGFDGEEIINLIKELR